MTMRLIKFNEAHERCLREQTITAEQPGTVLHDFGMLLEFVGPQGVEAGGQYNMLPIKSIKELDSRLSRPLHLKLKRPQIRSHPYLQGLNLLLRASGLSRVDGTGDKARLVLDPEMMVQWDRLNPTERYFNLLEAWLRFGRPEMVGERGSWIDSMLAGCLQAWRSLPEESRRSGGNRLVELYGMGVGRDLYKLALMDLFGLVAVELPAAGVTPWAPAGIAPAPFGDAVCALLTARLDRIWGDAVLKEPEDGEEAGEAGDDDDEGPDRPRFGVWQPIFQPYFPDWRENLEFPEPESREGIFVFRVSWGKDVWRLIAMSDDDTLDDLATAILRSLRFDFDHLYEFVYRDRMGATAAIKHPEMDEGPWTTQVTIGELPMEPGQAMVFHYDFGDNWRFDVKLERIEPLDAGIKAPAILEKHGKSPKQYPDWD
jgi:hypothetical protein